MAYQDHIASDPAILAGKPVIKGTRVPLSSILNFLAAGQSIEVILEAFPSVTKDDVYAVIQFAASAAQDDVPLLTKKSA